MNEATLRRKLRLRNGPELRRVGRRDVLQRRRNEGARALEEATLAGEHESVDLPFERRREEPLGPQLVDAARRAVAVRDHEQRVVVPHVSDGAHRFVGDLVAGQREIRVGLARANT